MPEVVTQPAPRIGNAFFQLAQPAVVRFGDLPIGASFEFEGRTFTKTGKHDAKPQRGKVSEWRVWLSFTPVTR